MSFGQTGTKIIFYYFILVLIYCSLVIFVTFKGLFVVFIPKGREVTRYEDVMMLNQLVSVSA